MRGMCFTCIGDMPTMTAETILRVKACPNKNCAIAFWIYNNHHEEWDNRNMQFWTKNPYLQLLCDEDDFGEIYEIMEDFEMDESDDESDDESECSGCEDCLSTASDEEPVQTIETEHDRSDDPSDETYDITTTIVSGIICKKCNNELPPMTMEQHLNGKGCPCFEMD